MTIDYLSFALSLLFLFCAILSGVRWLVIKKDYTWSSFLVVAVQAIAFVYFLILVFK